MAWTTDRAKADWDIWAWFAKNASGQWGVKVENVPGSRGPITGLVGKTIQRDGIKLMAGLFDASQPLIDGQPYTVRPSAPTRATRPFGFVNTNDGFGLTNVHAIVIEIPADKVVLGTPGKHRELHVWATTARRRGGAR